jgi:hypothetical protein
MKIRTHREQVEAILKPVGLKATLTELSSSQIGLRFEPWVYDLYGCEDLLGILDSGDFDSKMTEDDQQGHFDWLITF